MDWGKFGLEASDLGLSHRTATALLPRRNIRYPEHPAPNLQDVEVGVKGLTSTLG